MHLKNTIKVQIPENVKVSFENKTVTVEGPRGKLVRNFDKVPIDLDINEHEIDVTVWFPRAKLNAIPQTIATHIENMIIGVTKGYRTTMKAAHAHFPIEFKIEKTPTGQDVYVINFFGEKEMKKIAIPQCVHAELSKDKKNELTLTGNDIEEVSKSAASIHFSCKIRDKDLRKYLDGIYVLSKGPIQEE